MDLDFLIPPTLMLTGLGALLGVLQIARLRQRRPDRRSPLTEGLLRPPGHSLRERLSETQWDVASYLAIAVALPPMLYALYLQQRLSGRPTNWVTATVYLVLGVCVFVFVAQRMVAAIRKVRNETLGLEAEMAAAEEINRLMLRGYTAFHDVPAGKDFNIDHVIVGPTGVFAVETKGRPKKARGTGKAGSMVRYDGKCLHFPAWQETKPLDQATANAKWLRNWLTKSVGEPVNVCSVLLLPGWWVERTGRGEVMVGNAKEVRQMVDSDRGVGPLAESLQRRIVHQLDQRCRSIEPKAYSNK